MTGYDLAGMNTTLRPEESPAWLQTLVSRATEGNLISGFEQPAPAHQRRSAVLMLYSGTSLSDASVLLTHRTPTMRSHSGQVAFPGGRVDPEDTSPVDTALREAWEETGLDRRTVTPLAQLGELAIRATGNPVVPVLGYWQEPKELTVVSPDENDDIFRAPISELVNPANRFIVRMGNWQGPAFWHRGYVVWGFTAGVLAATIRAAGWEEPWNPLGVDLATALRSSRNGEQR
ncbi:NUDIX hydrolase [Corynebacterium hindlerae]|uniref:NUDIX hydrolase n=1 Tax=Corynebacterium hindlerae TaxID=699041 RepID=UPI0031B6BCBD